MKLIIVLFFLAWITLPSYGFPLVNYSVNWPDIGEIGAERRLNSSRLGFCVCDVTRGLCDPNCCCDPDCSEISIDFFTSCLPQQYGYPSIKYCTTDSIALLGGGSSPKDAVQTSTSQGPLCIVRENVPENLFPFFSVPTKVNFLEASTTFVKKNDTLRLGNLLNLVKYVNTTDEQGFKYFMLLSIPMQNRNGGCVFPGAPIPFMTPILRSSCAMNGEQICNELPIENFLNLFVETVSYFAPITINLYNSAGTLVETIAPPGTSKTTSSIASNTCRNGVTSVRGSMEYNGTHITTGRYDIIIADVGQRQYIPLSYEIAFTTTGQIMPSNIISGTPGYVIGTRLRAGIKESKYSKVAIVEQEIGFGIPSGGRNCDLNNFKTVRLGYDVISSGCFSSISEQELQSLCSVGTESYIRDILGVSQESNTLFLAKTNDALIDDPSSWIEVEGLNATNIPGEYDTVQRRCDNIAVGVKYSVITAKAGVVFNPQTIVVGIVAEFQRGSLSIRNSTDLSNGALSLQYFTFKVSFFNY